MRAGSLLLQPPRNPEQKLFLFITPMRTQDKLHAGLLALKSFIWDSLATKKPPRCLLEALRSVPCVAIHISPRSTFGQRRPRVYTGKMFAQGPAGDRKELGSYSFSSRIGIEP